MDNSESDVESQDFAAVPTQDDGLAARVSMLETMMGNRGNPLPTESHTARAQSYDFHAFTEITDDTDDRAHRHIQITAAETIADVRRCTTFTQFKNRFTDREGHFAIEVLTGGPNFDREIAEEQKIRDALASQSKTSKAKNLDHSARRIPGKVAVSTSQVDGVIRQVRIQSPAILKIMSRIQDRIWPLSPRTFYRPFESLIFFQGKMKEALRELEETWATYENVYATIGASTTDGDSIDDCPAALEVMRCYIRFVDEEIMPLNVQFDNLDVLSPPSQTKVRFSDLWFLFHAGTLVYNPPSKKDSKDPRDIIGSERIWRVHGLALPLAYTTLGRQREHESEDKDKDDAVFKVKCHYIDYSGEEFCVVSKTFTITPYTGLRDITSLEVFPLRFLPDHGALEEANLATGNKVISLIKSPHGSYNAWTVMRTPAGEPIMDEEGKQVAHPEHIHSDVMVDFAEAFQACPAWKPKRKILRAKYREPESVIDDFPIIWWSDASRSKRLGETSEIIATWTGVTSRSQNAYISEDEFHKAASENAAKGQLTTETHLRDEDKIIVSCRVFAYIFQERKFAQLDIRKVVPAQGSRNALDSLRIPLRMKELIQRSVRGHLLRREAERREHGRKISMDVIPGKGDGLFILLHGVPGVGKTATAEAMAQTFGKPLFKITCGDLGLTPKSVETRLRDIFRLASLWDCILLLDEVDTFFAQRSKGDAAMTKNALVSVFLRVLDYYNGILFMTTNRAGTLDEAFKSRIHYNIYYPHLSRSQTMEIWHLNIQRLRQVESENGKHDPLGPMEIADHEIMGFAEHQFDNSKPQHRWNGRQIRNAFQVARSLARADAALERDRILDTGSEKPPPNPRLDVKYFDEMHEMGVTFNQYIQSIYHGKTEGELAQEMEVRNDEFTWHPVRQGYPYDEPVQEGYPSRASQLEASRPRGFSGGNYSESRETTTWPRYGVSCHSPMRSPNQQGWNPTLPATGEGYSKPTGNGPLPEGIAPLSSQQTQLSVPGGHFGSRMSGDDEYGPEGGRSVSPMAHPEFSRPYSHLTRASTDFIPGREVYR